MRSGYHERVSDVQVSTCIHLIELGGSTDGPIRSMPLVEIAGQMLQSRGIVDSQMLGDIVRLHVPKVEHIHTSLQAVQETSDLLFMW